MDEQELDTHIEKYNNLYLYLIMKAKKKYNKLYTKLSDPSNDVRLIYKPLALSKSYLDMQPSTSGIIPSPANIISNTVSFNPIVSNRIDL